MKGIIKEYCNALIKGLDRVQMVEKKTYPGGKVIMSLIDRFFVPQEQISAEDVEKRLSDWVRPID